MRRNQKPNSPTTPSQFKPAGFREHWCAKRLRGPEQASTFAGIRTYTLVDSGCRFSRFCGSLATKKSCWLLSRTRCEGDPFPSTTTKNTALWAPGIAGKSVWLIHATHQKPHIPLIVNGLFGLTRFIYRDIFSNSVKPNSFAVLRHPGSQPTEHSAL